MLPTNGLRYQAQLLRMRNSRELSECWLRDNLRDNVLWCTNHYCLITGIPVNSCSCDICHGMTEFEGVKFSYLNGFFFVRAVLSEYPIGNLATNLPQDLARIRNYIMTESHISYPPWTWTPPTITQNNTDNATDNTDNSVQPSDSQDRFFSASHTSTTQSLWPKISQSRTYLHMNFISSIIMDMT